MSEKSLSCVRAGPRTSALGYVCTYLGKLALEVEDVSSMGITWLKTEEGRDMATLQLEADTYQCFTILMGQTRFRAE